jgi:hydroxymethylpyrimidine pyrophosphatase-like HAD family hydrolase
MKKLRIFVDVDGTLTDTQAGKSFFRPQFLKRNDVIAKVKEFSDQGHEIFIWTGSTRYANKVKAELEKLGIKIVAAFGKPNIMVDNEQRKLQRRLKKRVITPEQFISL